MSTLYNLIFENNPAEHTNVNQYNADTIKNALEEALDTPHNYFLVEPTSNPNEFFIKTNTGNEYLAQDIFISYNEFKLSNAYNSIAFQSSFIPQNPKYADEEYYSNLKNGSFVLDEESQDLWIKLSDAILNYLKTNISPITSLKASFYNYLKDNFISYNNSSKSIQTLLNKNYTAHFNISFREIITTIKDNFSNTINTITYPIDNNTSKQLFDLSYENILFADYNQYHDNIKSTLNNFFDNFFNFLKTHNYSFA